jgi:GTP-binding protein
VLGNVAIRVEDTDSPDVLQVAGRGELQLAVLIESMRREGYELEVSRPEVLTREIDGKRHEPIEEGVIDVADEHVGTVPQALAPRKGLVLDMRAGDPGRTIISFEAPARGLLGFRSQLLTVTRGTAMLHTRHRGWSPWAGDMPSRRGGAMVADRSGVSTGYALDNLQLRGELFIGPGEPVYEGMVVGESSRPGDMMVNVTREKQKTNIRTHAADDAIKLTPPRVLTIETAVDLVVEDELVEVTPSSVRVRKRILMESDRRRLAKR